MNSAIVCKKWFLLECPKELFSRTGTVFCIGKRMAQKLHNHHGGRDLKEYALLKL
jgi:hypothetical protein